MFRRFNFSFSRGKHFTETLQYRSITLQHLCDYVRFSFIVQKSLTPLDLKLCERYFDTVQLTFSYPSRVGGVCEFICTEEKCRKVLAPDRSVLYRLHLDLPKGREYSLHSRREIGDLVFDSSVPHIGNLLISTCWPLPLLHEYIVEALRHPGKELRILKWLLKFDEFSEIPLNIADILIKFLFSKKIHDPILKDFFNRFNFREWMVQYGNPQMLEYLLYEARDKGVILEDGRSYGLIDCCIISCDYSNIATILKYNYAATYSMDICASYLGSIRFRRVGNIGSFLWKAETSMNRNRYYKLLQFLKIYSNSVSREAESEIVRLLWESVPDSYLTSTEIKAVLGKKFTSKELTDMCNFYTNATGESHEFFDPRSLKHLCRTTIRIFLWAYKVWLPDGIKRLGLPDKLQSYLNLEKVPQKQSES